MTNDHDQAADKLEAAAQQQMFKFLVRFSDDVLEAAADRLATEASYNLLKDLSFEEYAVVVRKVLTSPIGRAN